MSQEPLSGSVGAEGAADADVRYGWILAAAPLLVYGAIALLNHTVFWDDAVLLAHSSASLLELFRQAGRVEQYLLIEPFAAFGQPVGWIVAELLLYAAIGPMIFMVVRGVTGWPASDAFWVALLTALAPLDQARFVLATLAYAFSSFFFILGLLVLLRDVEKPRLTRRIAIAVLLVGGFSTNSFLVLAWIAPAIVAILGWRRSTVTDTAGRLREVALQVLRRAELLVLPVVYWGGKELLEPTYGLYAHYNKFQMGIVPGLKQTVAVLLHHFAEAAVLLPAPADQLQLFGLAAAIAVVFALIARALRLRLRSAPGQGLWSAPLANGFAVLVAAALVVAALFPYVVVGQPPRFSGLWETRHQTTLLLVSGFAIVAVFRLVVPRPLLAGLAACTAFGFLVLDLSFTHKFIVDSLETRSIVALFEKDPPPPGTMVFVIEGDREYRAFGRFFPFYELSRMVNEKTGGNNLALSNQELIDPATGDYPAKAVPKVVDMFARLCHDARDLPQYGFGGFSANGSIETVRLTARRPPPGVLEAFADAVTAAFDPGFGSGLTSFVQGETETRTIGTACETPCCAQS